MKILELYKLIEDDIDLETETILEEHSLGGEMADAVSSLKTIIKMETIDDFYAFQKIALALAFKDVDFNRRQEPSLMDCLFAYVFCRNNMDIGDEVDQYMAGKCIYDNWLMLPPQLNKIQTRINSYLVQNDRYDILNMLNKVRFEDSFEKGTMEYFQKEKYRIIEEEILKEI